MGALGWDVYKESMLMDSADLAEVTRAFREAADAFGEVLDRPEVNESWTEGSAIDGYTVGAVVGHVNAAIGWLEALLDALPPADLRPMRLGSYYRGMKREPGGGAAPHPAHDVVRELSEGAARRGCEANREKFRSLVERLVARLEGESGERLLDLRPMVPAAIRLGDFLRTRVVELVVHADDLAASIGVEPVPPSEDSATVAIGVMTAVARMAHGDLAVVRALARRERESAAVFPVF